MRKNGKRLRYNAVRHILTNRVYIGEYNHSGIKIENSVPPLVEVDIFNAVQKGFATQTLLQRLGELEKERDEIGEAIAKEKIKTPIFTQDHFRMALHNFRKIDVSKQEGKRKIVDTFINAIYVGDDDFKLYITLTEKRKPLNLKSLKVQPCFQMGRQRQVYDLSFFVVG